MTIVLIQCLNLNRTQFLIISRPPNFVISRKMAGGQLVFQPPKFDWHAEDQQQVFDKWKGQITLALHASSIKQKSGLQQ